MLDSLRTFVVALRQRLVSRRDFEAVQTFQNVFLRMHAEVIVENPELQDELDTLMQVQKKESERVEMKDEKVRTIWCRMSRTFLRRSLIVVTSSASSRGLVLPSILGGRCLACHEGRYSYSFPYKKKKVNAVQDLWIL